MFHFAEPQTAHLYKISAAMAVVLTVLVASSLAWDIFSVRRHTEELASKEARSLFNKDYAFRLWAAKHGGVYVPIDAETPPNPNLAHIPERDITTPSGRTLTLMNPAYMTRQIMADFSALFNIRGKITTFPDKLLNPDNAPDAWELAALNAFQQGQAEISEFVELDDQPFLRFMRPLLIEQSCLKCHGVQGYQMGELRGGIGVYVPMIDYLVAEKNHINVMALTHGLIWLLSLGAIWAATRRSAAQIKQRLEAEEALRQAQKMDALGGLAGGIAHEINNMLLPIISLAQMTIKDVPNGSRQQKRLEKVVEAGMRAKSLVSGILSFSHRADVDVAKQRVNIVKAIEESLSLLRMALPSTISFETNLDLNTGHIVCDPTQISSVVLNLGSNAADAMAGRIGKITLSLAPVVINEELAQSIGNITPGKFAKLTVSDTGQGIAQQQLERIFDPFYTTKEVGKGTGLGLTMAYGVISQHNGAITVSSEVGVGTTFTIYLPLVD